MIHQPGCKEPRLTLEMRGVPETGEKLYAQRCSGCGVVEPLTKEEAMAWDDGRTTIRFERSSAKR